MNDWIERNGGHLIVLLLSVILNGTLVLILHRPPQSGLEIVVPTPSPTSSRVRVYVTGEVMAPDVYELPLGSLAKDALKAAGGGTADADLSQINLAQEIRDQSELLVPARPGAGSQQTPLPSQASQATPQQLQPPLGPSPQRADGGGPGGVINLNTAGVAELETLPGIGPALAQRIVEFRSLNGPFASIEALAEVRGIGPTTLERLRGRVVAN
jgi:competence protein ComEA